MPVSVSLTTPELDAEDLQVLTRDLCDSINDETELEAALPEGPTTAGSKGDPITLATIALAFITSGAAVQLITVLKAAVERKSTLQIEFERSDGQRLAINAENLSADRLGETIKVAKDFLEEPA